MNLSKTNEQALEACIERHLTGGVTEVVPVGVMREPTPDYGGKGFRRGESSDFKPEFAIDEAKFWQFLEATQPKELAKLHYKADWKRQVLERLHRKLKKDGILALVFHGIGTQRAHEVWIQLPSQSRVPKIDWPPIRVIRTRLKSLQTQGVEIHQLGGTAVPITTPARTVADCFKHRNKLGIDVCVEALRETVRERKATIGEIGQMARLLRVGKVVQPYLEAMQ